MTLKREIWSKVHYVHFLPIGELSVGYTCLAQQEK